MLRLAALNLMVILFAIQLSTTECKEIVNECIAWKGEHSDLWVKVATIEEHIMDAAQVLQSMQTQITTLVENQGDCSLPYVKVNGQCLLFLTGKRGWDDSRSICQNYIGTDIAILTDIQKVTEYMRTNNLLVTWWHIGANNRGDNSKHTWINAVDVSLTERWEDDEPTLSGNQCVHIHPTHEGGVIADNRCTVEFPVICYKC